MKTEQERIEELCILSGIKFPYKCPCCGKIIKSVGDIEFVKSDEKHEIPTEKS